ncbi:Acetoin:2,6-dichlorophenolindophenol oxidoreductase subunit alpha,alpha-ketoglutarate decarboxylase,pyruvate dehydrogenase (acetyl-transferring) E1 component, alpha subunit,Dehydrogenase E1 component [Chlamydia serpentis]|uniref:Pyruvate dehydrogenase E1 component subunit alpha n=1 Tax=Chlamydia serpentis TaxID=1967782 RepID=A0A2R8FAJ8_9CHLA|nr:pyruvate dehydrogenase (acetyl-transferring) E1 component subunit alpha [Chlamydia serpentis]SPN73448.1 Acetoin:2,6-dichlorophenolindophenol oxidoreductase subunit alpha,alpha-ketoglutarate decarboxylase,pyruvate dehydrogenase (acetyl-transferring) E1 component, alpha subunit,Dehydrogenase E1 component [Chlamydia serpentis]
MDSLPPYNIASQDTEKPLVENIIDIYGPATCSQFLKQMILIREFESQGETAYQEGLIGGFYHSYTGQEAVATAAIANTGSNQWVFSSYRCHALAILLKVPLEEIAAELLGKETGCALGRGGSMHMCGPNFPGGFGIVGGQIPLAAGAAFAIKYLKEKNKIALAFIGDGAVAQGVFHETLNFVSLHQLPLMLIIENNGWGMGTSLNRAVAKQPIAESQGASYGIRAFTINGFDLFNSLVGFREAYRYMLDTESPVLIECLCSRFRGHSVSDPNLYRSKEEMQCLFKKDPITFAKNWLIQLGVLTEEEFQNIRKQCKAEVLQAFSKAKLSPEPSITTLEEGVYG